MMSFENVLKDLSFSDKQDGVIYVYDTLAIARVIAEDQLKDPKNSDIFQIYALLDAKYTYDRAMLYPKDEVEDE